MLNNYKNTKMSTCSGDGYCLSQTDSNMYKKNTNVISEFNCKPIKCLNYIICGKVCPLHILNNYRGICLTCDVMFNN